MSGGTAALSVALCVLGRPTMPVVTAPKAAATTIAAARDLAETLGRLCGSPFPVETGDGSRGIAVGTTGEFPGLLAAGTFDAPEPFRREQYVLRSRTAGLWAIGAEAPAVEDAVADLLYRAGYRRFFPGQAWEIVPSRPELALAVDVKEDPSFATRSIWYSDGAAEEDRRDLEAWRRRNRQPGLFLDTGHAYDGILERNKAAFASHPEYLGLLGGRRVSTKFCLSNPGLRRLLVEDALRRAEGGDSFAVSVEPSDGEGWCECPACRAMGSVSDRVVTAANEAARALAVRFPGRFAAFYAYNLHAPPPSLKVDEGVIVTVATAFLPRGWTPEALLKGWARRGARRLGVREYYGILDWHWDLPGRMRGGDLAYLSRTIAQDHALGARFLSAEAGEDWGANGLGYYVASRLLWDVSEARRYEAIREDFLGKAFGAAKEPMRRFYALIDGSGALPKKAVPSGLVARMYALLGEAAALNRDAAVEARLDDLALYTRYVELFAAYDRALDGRQEAFEALVRHVRRLRARRLVYVDALLEMLPKRDARVSVPKDESAADFSHEEAVAVLRGGLRDNPL